MSERPIDQQPRVHVRGVDRSGSLCVERWLRHGDDPKQVLAQQGWASQGLVSITTLRAPSLEIALDFRVCRAPSRAAAPSVAEADPHLTAREGELPVRHQRVAAYAVVRSARGILMTELSGRTSRPGTWALPGGGLDPGEDPDDAVVREVWEESGQHVRLMAAIDVISAHWIGRAPSGRLEDFHAIRLIYSAACPAPTDPVVHDVGGTTASAAWMSPEELAQVKMSAWASPLVLDVSDASV